MFFSHVNDVWNWNKIIWAAERVLELFQDIIISATLNMLENIHELQ